VAFSISTQKELINTNLSVLPILCKLDKYYIILMLLIELDWFTLQIASWSLDAGIGGEKSIVWVVEEEHQGRRKKSEEYLQEILY
jgi:hypothetical protein